MSRTPASYSMLVTRGSTWEDEFVYVDESGAAVDLTGYSARMQVREPAGEFGLSTAETLVLELTTTNGLLEWDTAEAGRLTIVVPPAQHAMLNPLNDKKRKYVYSVELSKPLGAEVDYVIPLVKGKIIVFGETVR